MPGNTISSTLANEFSEAVGDTYTSSLIALGLILFLVTFVVLAWPSSCCCAWRPGKEARADGTQPPLFVRRRGVRTSSTCSCPVLTTLFGLFWLGWLLWTLVSHGLRSIGPRCLPSDTPPPGPPGAWPTP